MHKILLVGNLCFGTESYNGQTSKSRGYYTGLAERYGEENILISDTAQYRKKPFSSYFRLRKLAKQATEIVLLLGMNSAKFIFPILAKLKKKYKFRIYWSCVGGGLLYDKKIQKKLLPYFDMMEAIYFETKAMVDYFSDGIRKNLYYAPVFTERKLNQIFEPNKNEGILHFCTYARVCREKGITLAINAIKKINTNGIKCTLDIFGTPYPDYVSEFQEALLGTEKYINSNDYLSGDGVIDRLYQFDAMLFPTFYSGEGFPIGIIECYCAGVPVIASDWHYNSEIVLDGETGYIFNLENENEFVDCINKLIEDRDLALAMRHNAYNYSQQFTAASVLQGLYDKIDCDRGNI